MVASWEKLERIEQDLSATLIPTHDLRFRERIRMAPDEWYA
jgi:hypothetical protein